MLALLALTTMIAAFPASAAAQSVPDRPGPPTASLVAHDKVTVVWPDLSDTSVTSYQVLRKNRSEGSSYVVIATVDASVLSYEDETVSASTDYGYRIRALNDSGQSRRSVALRVSVPAPPASAEATTADNGQPISTLQLGDDYSADTTTLGAVAVGSSVAGEIEIAEDRDWFAVTLQAGTAYRFDLEGAPTGAGTLQDPYLFGIAGSGGSLIAGTANDDDGHGRNSRATYVAASSGTHYVMVGAYRYDTGSYTLTVAATPTTQTDDCSSNVHTSCSVTVGGTASGSVEASGDRDWFAVELQKNKTYRIEVRAEPTAEGTLLDPELDGLYDLYGIPISGTADDDSGTGRNSQAIFTAWRTGTHYVSAQAYASFLLGTYVVAVTDVS